MNAFLTALFALLGPIISKAFEKWLETLFAKAAKKVKVGDNATDKEKADALFSEALKLTPRTRPGKRLFLKMTHQRVLDENGKLKKKLDSTDKEEMVDAVNVAKKDL